MESFAEYRVGHNNTGHKHWIECRGEVIAQVVNVRSGQMGDEEVVWHYGADGHAVVKSEVPGWKFEGRFPSIGHCLTEVARSHRKFVEPNAAKRLCREIALWPQWGKIVGGLFVLAALAEILGFIGWVWRQ